VRLGLDVRDKQVISQPVSLPGLSYIVAQSTWRRRLEGLQPLMLRQRLRELLLCFLPIKPPLGAVDAHLSLGFGRRLEFDNAIGEGKEGVIAA